MAERLRPGVWSNQGTILTLPLTIPSARLTAAVLASPLRGARQILAGTPLRPLRIRALVVSSMGRSSFRR
jgi:hypothetical protein